jgi:hypothetical protein
MRHPDPLNEMAYGDYLISQGYTLNEDLNDWNSSAAAYHEPNSLRRAQGSGTVTKLVHVMTLADELAARLNADPRSKTLITPPTFAMSGARGIRETVPEPTPPPSARRRRLPELQICRDHESTKQKIAKLEKEFRDEMYAGARRLHRRAQDVQRKQAHTNGPVYHFWREFSGFTSWDD